MKLFCDMDDVLVDFVLGFKMHCGFCITTSHLEGDELWGRALRVPRFWADLPKMPEADALVDFMVNNIDIENRYILSARQHLFENCDVEKREWITTHAPIFLDENIKIVNRSEKQNFAVTDGIANVLVDDYHKNIAEWVSAGGIGILHTDVDITLSALRGLFSGLRTCNS